MSWKTILKSYPKIQWVDGSRQTTRKFTDWMKMRDAYYNGFNLNNGKIPNSIFQIAKFTKILYENVTDTKINLTAIEFRLLKQLVDTRGRVQSRDQLLSDVWGYSAEVTTRTVDTHVKRLREKLGPMGKYVQTIRGVGYKFARSPD